MKKASAARPKPAPPAHPLEGHKAPPIVLPDADGNSVRLADLLGKGPLVLYFYPKDMTPGCTQEACDFRDSLRGLASRGARVIGISTDSPESHRKFRDKYELNFTLLSDRDKTVVKAYGVYKQKSLYGRQFMGIERTTFVLDNAGVVRKIFPKVKVKGHTQAVLDALSELG